MEELNMPAKLDHIVLAVADLKNAAQRVHRILGLHAEPGGIHDGAGTENMIVPLGRGYLELVTVHDSALAATNPFGDLVTRALGRGELFAGWATTCDIGDTHADPTVSRQQLVRDGETFSLSGIAESGLSPDVPFRIARPSGHPISEHPLSNGPRVVSVDLMVAGDADLVAPEGIVVRSTRTSNLTGRIVRVSFAVPGRGVVTLTNDAWDAASDADAPSKDVEDARLARMVQDRRALHRIPEVGLHLPDTQAYLMEQLGELDLDIETGRGLSSIVATLHGTAPTRPEQRPAVLLRSDMDALPVTEATGYPFASKNGAMHACGHDLHMAMVLEAARALHARRDTLPGDVVFFFQPGEENHGGAKLALAEGVLAAKRNIVSSFGLHVLADQLTPGIVGVRRGPIMAGSTLVTVRFHGHGGHGSAPHRAKSPIPAAAEFVTSVTAALAQGIDMFESSVLTFGAFLSGDAHNVLPETAELRGTLRTFDDGVTETAQQIITRVARGIASAHGLRVDVDLQEICAPVVNPDTEVDFVEAAANAADAPLHWLRNPISVSEDFSYLLQAGPGAFALVGAAVAPTHGVAPAANHSPEARFDEDVLLVGADLMTNWVVTRLTAACGGDVNTDDTAVPSTSSCTF